MGKSDWKDQLLEVLLQTGVIQKGFSGRVVININQGGVTELEKVERVETDPE